MSEDYEAEDVEVFSVGTVGEPGQRTFFLQVGDPGAILTLKLEKQQVAAIAEYLDGVLSDLEPIDRDDLPLALELIEPVEAAWTVGAIGAAHLSERDRVVLVVEEVSDDDDEHADPATARITLTRPQVRSFIEQARELVSAGRPPCPFCGAPLDGDGTWCPCHN